MLPLFRRTPRTYRRAPGAGRHFLSLERLEDRLVPAGDLLGAVVVFGDSLSDVGLWCDTPARITMQTRFVP